jgi:Zn-finger nucleic acid-binding protein
MERYLVMSIRVQCEGCQKRYMVPDRSSGRTIKCKDCGQAISIPDEPEPKRSSPAKQKRKQLACPACVKSSLTERIVKDGLCVDVCRSCRGTWLDGGLTVASFFNWRQIQTRRNRNCCRSRGRLRKQNDVARAATHL